MLEALLTRWQLLAARERRALAGAAALLAVVLAWLVLFEPAWDGRQRARGELPVLRAQLAQMEQLAGEAQRLGAVPGVAETPQAIQSQLRESVASAGLGPALSQLTHSGGLFELRFKSVPYAAWLAWLDSAVRETRLRVVDAAVMREAGIGVVSARLSLELPARDGRAASR